MRVQSELPLIKYFLAHDLITSFFTTTIVYLIFSLVAPELTLVAPFFPFTLALLWLPLHFLLLPLGTYLTLS
jgi:hypothetical protein